MELGGLLICPVHSHSQREEKRREEKIFTLDRGGRRRRSSFLSFEIDEEILHSSIRCRISDEINTIDLRRFQVMFLFSLLSIIDLLNRYLFTIGETCVYLWFVDSGQLSRALNRFSSSNSSTSEGEERIVSIALNPHNRLQLCVAQSNGTINIWDYEDSILIHVTTLLSLHSLHSSFFTFLFRPLN